MGLHYLSPDGYEGGSWGNNPGAVDDPFGSHDGDATTVVWDGVADSEARYTLSPMRDALSIAQIKVYVVIKGAPGPAVGSEARVLIKSGGSTFYGPYSAIGQGSYSELTNIWLTDPFDSQPWTRAKLDALVAGCSARDTSAPIDTITLTQVVVAVTFTPSPLADAPRERATRSLRQSARPSQGVEIVVPIAVGDVRMLGLLPVSHPRGTSADGKGWGEALHQRRPTILVGRRYMPSRYAFQLTALDMVPGIGLWSLYRSLRSKSPASRTLPGVGRSDANAKDTLIRNSRAWVETVDGRVIGVDTDAQKTERRGTLFEPARTNDILNSSMKDGVGSQWTLINNGVNGASITNDTTDLYFASSESAQSAKLLIGTGPTGVALQQVRAVLANEIRTFSYDHKDETAGVVSWDAQRSTDNWWWNDSSGAWQSASVRNVPSASRTKPARVVSKPINVGGSNANITLRCVFDDGGANATAHVYHVQFEVGRWASSRILTQAAAVTRAADNFYVESQFPPHIWPWLRGTGFALVVPDWNSGDVTAETALRILRVDTDRVSSGVAETVTLDPPNGRFLFRRSQAGTLADAAYVLGGSPLARGVAHVVAWRWVSDQGELGLARGTISIFLDGVKGTDAAPASSGPFAPVPAGTVRLAIGGASLSAGTEWGGSIAELLITPLVLDDAAIADYSAYLLASAA